MPPQSNTGQLWRSTFCVERTRKYSSTASGAAPSPLKRANKPSASAPSTPANANAAHSVCACRKLRSAADALRVMAGDCESCCCDVVLRGISSGRLRGVSGKLNNTLDLIILEVASVREDDQLAEQTNSEQLQSKHNEQRSEQQGRPLSERLSKAEPCDDQ